MFDEEQVQEIAADLVAAGWDELDALHEARKIVADRISARQILLARSSGCL
jgi:hypothetical protein